MSQNKMPPDQYSQMIKHLTRRKIQNPFIPDSAIEKFCEAALKSFLERVNKIG